MVGPRQSGKSTLCRELAKQLDLNYYTMDDDGLRSTVSQNPYDFIEKIGGGVVDEIQRVPDLAIAFKRFVDVGNNKNQNGRFLITGSVDLFSGFLSGDLADRVVGVKLLPLSQGEIHGVDSSYNFIEFLLKKREHPKLPSPLNVGKTSFLRERISVGGYPQSVKLYKSGGHFDWLEGHISSFKNQNFGHLFSENQLIDMDNLIGLLSVSSARLVNYSQWASYLGVSATMVMFWLQNLERISLVQRIVAWNDKDLIKSIAMMPKVYFLDSGLLLAALSESEGSLDEIFTEINQLNHIVESFIFSEVFKLACASKKQLNVFYYQGPEKVEVDLLVKGYGKIVAIEVKTATKVYTSDFHGLRHLQKICGDRFSCGILLHDGDKVECFAPGLYAMPFHVLWSAPEEIFKV